MFRKIRDLFSFSLFEKLTQELVFKWLRFEKSEIYSPFFFPKNFTRLRRSSSLPPQKLAYGNDRSRDRNWVGSFGRQVMWIVGLMGDRANSILKIAPYRYRARDSKDFLDVMT